VSYRIGIDVGGTFTDFVLLNPATGLMIHHKQASTPDDPARAILLGAEALLHKAGVAAAEVALVVHGTTLSLNAILQRRFARMALAVSPGNRDILEIARVRMADPYGFFAEPDAPLTARENVFELPARLSADGEVLLAPTDEDYDQAAKAIAATAPDAVAVVLLNACAHPAFEAEVAAALAQRLGCPVDASTALWPEEREYERAMVAILNAAITPIMQAYYARLEQHLADLGLLCPLAITTSNGGSVDLATAMARPIDTILSGPASGVVAAIRTAQQAALPAIVTLDIGGTSADIAVAEGDTPDITTDTQLGEIPLILPVVNVNAIGSGGGSIVRVDSAGFLKVGPGSAGAVPGPACFAKGGTQATITDAYLLCGLLDAERFGGGALRLEPWRAEAQYRELAERLGYDGDDALVRAADAALQVASSMMATEIRKSLARRGADPAGFVLVPYGGGGPTHAALTAEQAGLDRILVPARPGILCALGATLADLRRDFVRSTRLALRDDDAAVRQAFVALCEELASEADAWADDIAGRASHWRRELSADLRYPDQAFNLSITVALGADSDPLAELVAAFHARHLKLYGFNEPDAGVEASRLVLTVLGSHAQAPLRSAVPEHALAARERQIFINGGWHSAQVIDREQLAPGSRVAGPAVLEQSDTTTLLPAGWDLQVLSGGSLLLQREEAGA